MRDYVSRQCFRVVGAGVAAGPHNLRAGEPSGQELVQEENLFFGSSDSIEPVGQASPFLFIHGFPEDNLRAV